QSLNPAMTRWDLTALAINTVIGSGIFVLPSSAARLLGAWGPVGLLICAAIIYVVVLCFAEVSSHFNRIGGSYLYAGEAFGPFVGFEIGWTMWLARVSAFAANSIVLITYVSFFLPQTAAGVGRVVALVATTAVITFINVRGVADGARFG